MWELDHKESWAPKNCCFWTVALSNIVESHLDSKGLKPVNPKGNRPEYSLKGLILRLKLQYLVTWCEELTHWKKPWYLEGGEGDDRGWDGWMASLTRWTWVWAISRSWWWTVKPSVLHFMGSKRVRHIWMIELNWLWNSSVEEYKTIFKDPSLFSDFTKTPCWSQQLGLPISILILHISLTITGTRLQAKALNVGYYIKLLLKHLGKIHAWEKMSILKIFLMLDLLKSQASL